MLRKSVVILLAVVATALALTAQEVRVLVAYHSESGHTEKMANALARGARSLEGATALVRRVGEVTREDLASCDAIALGSPVHMGDAAWQVRQALVRWAMEFGFWDSRALTDKAAAVFATGAAPSNGKELTMMSLGAGLTQLGMVLVTPYGSLGASATTSKPDPGVDAAEEKIAEALGRRLAEVAVRLKRGKR
ncbi:MAG: flavodoxin domain-containing protein [Bryobacterales bacterium]|nr:flavodoxin domain-containing protein [Bryobacterales bacterium]